MDLRRKLALLDGGGLRAASRSAEPGRHSPALRIPTPAPTLIRDEASARIDRLRRGLEAMGPVGSPGRLAQPLPAPIQRFPAERRDTPQGVVHVCERWFDSDHCHGRAPLAAAVGAEAATIAALALDPTLREIDPGSMLLLDTETTGLSGGTGTLPFVVGLGGFEGGRLRVTQFLLRQPGEERPILATLADRLARAGCIVTYNGKTFDWPLLRSRYVMNRLPVPPPRPHLDLLHCARRILRYHSGGARLVQLEEALLGHTRCGDIPGEQIAERYFRYLRSRDGTLLAPVLEHNLQDVLLLAALLGLFAREFRSASARDPRTLLGYAALAERAGDARRALDFAEAAAMAEDGGIRAEALVLIARLARRRGDDRAAAEVLHRAAQTAIGARCARIHLELAKLYEHRLGDLPRALEHARHTEPAEGGEEHRRRLERLGRRAARVSQGLRSQTPRRGRHRTIPHG